MMPIYLAGASRELDRVLPIVERLRASGLVRFTYEWWQAVQKHGVGTDHELSNDDRRIYALREMTAIGDARVFWLLYPDGASGGAFTELGVALRGRPTTVVTGKRSRESNYAALANFEHESDDAGFQNVLELACAYRERP